MEVFTVLDRKPWMKVISSVWAFKRKHFPDGSVRKLKARLCARGFEQIEGRDYFETFAPTSRSVANSMINSCHDDYYGIRK
jgi:hypothetical protein